MKNSTQEPTRRPAEARSVAPVDAEISVLYHAIRFASLDELLKKMGEV